jgi:thiosulfate/3-mercaptopyruvate sulfurtransferase
LLSDHWFIPIKALGEEIATSAICSTTSATNLRGDFYRRLHRKVGSDCHWVDRLPLPDEELQAIIHDDQVDVLLLSVGEEPAGYSELDRREPGEIELAYFGLFREAIGQGFGKYLLSCTLRAAWSQQPQRVWVHTCDLDHPAALPNYLKVGFRILGMRSAGIQRMHDDKNPATAVVDVVEEESQPKRLRLLPTGRDRAGRQQ